MSDATTADDVSVSAAEGGKGGKKKIILLAAVVLLLGGGGAGVYFSGLAGKLFGGGHAEKTVSAEPGSFELPDIIANLNAGPRRSSFVKVKVRLELAHKSDEAAAKAGEPQLLDLFQTYLRDMHPEELRGAAATYRLREELLARANIALAPVKVNEILFLEMLIQ